MTTRNSQSGEKKQMSARDTREPKPRIGVKEEPDIKSRHSRLKDSVTQKVSEVREERKISR